MKSRFIKALAACVLPGSGLASPGHAAECIAPANPGGGWYLFSSPISIGLWIAAIAGFVAPMFMRGLLQKPQRITE